MPLPLPLPLPLPHDMLVGIVVGVFVGVFVMINVGVSVGVGVISASETVIDDVQSMLLPPDRLWLATSQFPGPPFALKLPLKPAFDQACEAEFTLEPTIDGTVHMRLGVLVGVGEPSGVPVDVTTGVGTGVGTAAVSEPQPIVMLREATAFTLTCGIKRCTSGSSSGNE